ncbi:MAG: VOC family protein [Dehalococcoidales bacterium]|nr:MAG: VOC family protein [Dehalococcoidales bacterium]
MLVPHLYLDGDCEEAISQYVKAFGAEMKVLIYNSDNEPKKGVMHSEIYIHGQRIMLNDSSFKPPGLVVIYDNKEDLMNSYEIMKEGGQITDPMIETSYSSCTVGICDRFGINWVLMVIKP